MRVQEGRDDYDDDDDNFTKSLKIKIRVLLEGCFMSKQMIK